MPSLDLKPKNFVVKLLGSPREYDWSDSFSRPTASYRIHIEECSWGQVVKDCGLP